MKQYRVWHDDDLWEMVYNPDNELYFRMVSNHGVKVSFETPFRNTDWIMEEGVGKSDKTGKEIFQGDKIRTYRFVCKNGKQAIEYYNKIISSGEFHQDCYILGNIIASGKTVEIIGTIHDKETE